MRCVRVKNKKSIGDFIRLSHHLYNRHNNTQNDQELRQLLVGEHILSPYFTLTAFCIYDGKHVVGRFAITAYEGDEKAYLGFYEAVNRKDVAQYIFSCAESFVEHEGGYCKIVGPVGASFWIKYRLKISGFDQRPYTGEPYNMYYYKEQFERNGYEVVESYTSSFYRNIPRDYKNEKSEKRYKDFTEKGYEFVQPSNETWDKTVDELYDLITDLYSSFPIYKALRRDDFRTYFKSYRQIINYEMVRMVYFEGKAVGFYISVPDYSNLVYHTNNPINLMKILNLKKKPKSYVILYMGAGREHLGLGSAILKTGLDALKENQLPYVGALMRYGKLTRGYAKDMVVKQCEYALYEKDLNIVIQRSKAT